MNELEKIFSLQSAIVGSVFAFCCKILGGYDALLQVVLVAMLLDYITGIIKAYQNKNLSSKAGINGIIKKVVMLMIVSFCVSMNEIWQLIGTGINIRNLILLFYLGNESISLFENCEAIGVPIPKAIKKALSQLKKK